MILSSNRPPGKFLVIKHGTLTYLLTQSWHINAWNWASIQHGWKMQTPPVVRIEWLLCLAKIIENMKPKVLPAVIMLVVFWNVMPCKLRGGCQYFGGTYCLQLQGWCLRHACTHLQGHTTSQPRRPPPTAHKVLHLQRWFILLKELLPSKSQSLLQKYKASVFPCR